MTGHSRLGRQTRPLLPIGLGPVRSEIARACRPQGPIPGGTARGVAAPRLAKACPLGVPVQPTGSAKTGIHSQKHSNNAFFSNAEDLLEPLFLDGRALVHNSGGIAGTTGRLSTGGGLGRLLSPFARQRQRRLAHRVWRRASACHATGKCTCPQKSPCSTTTTMYL